MNPLFLQLLATRYPAIKSQFPSEGRRRWFLRAIQQFWASTDSPGLPTDKNMAPQQEDYTRDGDPLDDISRCRELGILLRTDYSNEEAWQACCARLQDAEKELAETVKEDGLGTSNDASTSDVDMEADDDSASEASNNGIPSPIIKVVNPTTADSRAIFTAISNLTALRLLNDVDIRPSPPLRSGTSRINPPHRLIDYNGWQEIYTGANIWIYDELSNTDQCVRLVGHEGDVYGTATGDSWRARVTHICELQFNMSYLGMKIDFGGMDRWDYNERRRNLEEAEMPII